MSEPLFTGDPRVRALLDDTSKVMEELSGLSRKLTDLGKTKVGELSGEAVAGLQDQFKSIQQRVLEISGESRKTLTDLDRSVRANPYVYILCALGLGMLLGKGRRP
jgi:ElaB/YqjD/DUF883 family membrane-anchored ribosome-binding protein